MSKPPRPLELALPDGVAAAELFAAIGSHLDLEVVPGATISRSRTYYDTFDGRIHAAGLVLERDANADGNRLFVDGLPAGPERDRLAPVVEMRASLPVATVDSSIVRSQVRDAEGKTVVRLAWERPAVRRPKGPPAKLAPRLHVSPVRGYDGAYRQVVAFLGEKRGLAEARPSLLDDAVTQSGGIVGGVSAKPNVHLTAGMRADDATYRICRRLADIAEANLPGTLDDIDTEFLHDLRVAVRRTRSVLREMRGVLEPAARERARTDLRWIQEITGPTRDLDVLLLDWPSVIASLPASTGADLAPLHDLLARHRARAWRTMCDTLRGPQYAVAWSAWRELLARPQPRDAADAPPNADRTVAAVAGERIVAVYRAMVAGGLAIDDASPPVALHDLRKRGKELRYLLELFGSLWPSATVGPLVSTLKALQDVLGRFQDDEVQATFLRSLGPELARTRGGPDALVAVGTLVHRLADDQAAARRAFAARFEPFAAKPTRKLVMATFRP